MSKQKKSKKEKKDLSGWKELYQKMMKEKTRIATVEAVMRGKLRGTLKLTQKIEDFSIKVEEHINDSDIEGIDLYKVYNDGCLISELVIYDDGGVRELPRSRPPVDANEINFYYHYVTAQDGAILFDELCEEYSCISGANSTNISLTEFIDWLIKNKDQNELMIILDNILNQFFKTN